ncbi:MAG TPA: efflux RND transporter periplasmic adaptor subunit, partial [Patescibacteria group bacterium]|nr:efflux RND transporter periplasmic adaptor subunit [Patescibacteria group bacterium]
MNRFSTATAVWLIAAMLVLSACGKDAKPPAGNAAKPASAQAKVAEQHADDAEDAHGDEHADEGADEHGDEHGEEGEEGMAPIRMDAAAMKAAGIRVGTLAKASLREELRTPGEVVDNAYGTTLITPRVEALVVRRHAKLGDEVKAGAPLVTLSSVEVATAQGTLSIAEQDWKRVQALGREAVSGRRYSEAQVAV